MDRTQLLAAGVDSIESPHVRARARDLQQHHVASIQRALELGVPIELVLKGGVICTDRRASAAR